MLLTTVAVPPVSACAEKAYWLRGDRWGFGGPNGLRGDGCGPAQPAEQVAALGEELYDG